MKITKQSGRACVKLEKRRSTLYVILAKNYLSSGSTTSNWELGLNLPTKRY